MLTLNSLAQITYPIAQIIKGDTNIIITPLQLKFANRLIVKSIFLDSTNSKLKVNIIELEKSYNYSQLLIKENESKIKNYDISIEQYTELIERKNNTIDVILKQAKKDKRKAIVTSGIIGIIAGLVLSVLI